MRELGGEAHWAGANRPRGCRTLVPEHRELSAVWGDELPLDRAPRVLGLFAHPDDEVFCAGGTIARCATAGATTAIVSLTRGEAGQIRDAAAATRRTLGAVRAEELARSAAALGADHAECLDLGDGRLADRPLAEVAASAHEVIEQFEPDVVVTFGPDGAFGHPDHVTSCLATVEALRSMVDPPRLLHAQFPTHGDLMLDVIVDWLRSHDRRFSGTAAFGRALRLFADGTSMLGFTADHFSVEWLPAGSFVIEQGEQASELFYILSGSVDIVVEGEDGRRHQLGAAGAGSFVGEEGIATGRPRNAHVIAREDVTCLVFAPRRPDPAAARGPRSVSAPGGSATAETAGPLEAPVQAPVGECFTVDVSPVVRPEGGRAGRAPVPVRAGGRPLARLDVPAAAGRRALRRRSGRGRVRRARCPCASTIDGWTP